MILKKSPQQLDREFASFYARARLERRVQKLLDKWEPILGVQLREFHIKKMTAWGSTNPKALRLWISLKLANMSEAALEYVVVHELAHLALGQGTAGSGHDAPFYALLDRVLPTWRRRHARLYSDGVVAKNLPGMKAR